MTTLSNKDLCGFAAATFPGSEYVPALFGIAVYFYGELVFVEGGLQEPQSVYTGTGVGAGVTAVRVMPAAA